ncbi:MAG: ABC transporter ATP-binding protein/permease [Roseiarcus sp.]|jgi:putative ATP-binding cassette transporter
MRTLSLAVAVFALIAFALGLAAPSALNFVIAAAAAASAVTTFRSTELSSFLKIFKGLFGVETIVFGFAYLVAETGYWPEAYKEYSLPSYLPLATALFGIAIFGVSHIPLVRRMMSIADPFFEARTPLPLRIWPFPRFVASQAGYAKACIVFLILINQFEVALTVRLNFFQADFGNALQVPDAIHRTAFWHQLLAVFTPVAMILVLALVIEFYVASVFVLQWRRWMTVSYTTRWLLNSMHYKLMFASDLADNPDQRISQDVGSFINGGGTGIVSGNVGIYNYTIQVIQSSTNFVSFSIILWSLSNGFKLPYIDREAPGLLFWVAFLYACAATYITQVIGGRLSKLYFKQQAVEADFRFSLTRIREYSEQIALLRGENSEISAATNRFEKVFDNYYRIIGVRKWLLAFNQAYNQISVIIPYVISAPFYYLGKISLGQLSQTADAFGNVNAAMNFFVNQYVGLADFKSTLDRLASFDAAFARTLALRSQTAGIRATPSPGDEIAIPDLAVDLPDGTKLARIGDLVLVPQEPTLVIGPSGVGKSTLFRAIAGIWPFGQGEIHQPRYAKLMLLPQRPYIPMGSLREAIAYPAAPSAYSDEAIRDALVKVGLPALADRLDDVDNWQMRLSGGEQQRLAIARALLAAPDWLFLDEATSALDEASESQVYRAVAQTLPKTTLVSIGHRATLAAFHKRRIALTPHVGAPATIAAAE